MDTSLEITNSVDTVYSTPMSEFVASYDNVFATRSVDNYLYRLDPQLLQAYVYEDVTSPSNLIVADNNDIHLIAESEQYGKEIYECSHASSTCSIVYDTNTEIEKYGEPTPGDIGSTASSNLAMGEEHSCAIFDGGSIMCSGFNSDGRLGDGTTTSSSTPVAVSLPAGRTAKVLAVGSEHTCAILSNDSAMCWGENNYGQVGNGTTGSDQTLPNYVAIPNGRTATALALGSYHSCAILDDGSAMCWGRNIYGHLGDGTNTDSNTPVAVGLPAGRTATALALGSWHSCAILDDGSVHCWGYNGYAQLGDGATTDSSTPVAVSLPAGRTATALALGNSHSCAILDDGSVHCWGYNGYGQLGDGTTTDSNIPVAVNLPAGRTATALAVGRYHSCAILDNDAVSCWGLGNYGQLGNGQTFDYANPTYSNIVNVKPIMITSGGDSNCVLLDNGTAMCWASNGNGQFGDGTNNNQLSPVLIDHSFEFVDVVTGEYHSCAIIDDGSAMCWGYNYYGQLGDGTTTGQRHQ